MPENNAVARTITPGIYTCPDCKKEFLTFTRLNWHRQKYHTVNMRKTTRDPMRGLGWWECNRCGARLGPALLADLHRKCLVCGAGAYELVQRIE